MTHDISLDYSEFSDWADELAKNLPASIDKSGEKAMEQAVTYLHSQIPPAPALSPTQRLVKPDGSSFLRTDKQRKWFFANLAEGNIKGWRIGADGKPEKFATARTNDLNRRFTTSVETKKGTIEGAVGTNLSYAPWVVGDTFPGSDINGLQMYQAQVHVDRWWQFVEEMEAKVDEANQIFVDEFMKNLKEDLNG